MSETAVTLCKPQSLKNIDLFLYFHCEKSTLLYLFADVNEEKKKSNEWILKNYILRP
jgi:hypothetical protein